MAQLITTPEEDEKSFMDWDDASLGKAVKKMALFLESIDDTITMPAAAAFLITRAIDIGSDRSTMVLEGVTDGDKPIGDWEISVKRIQSCQP